MLEFFASAGMYFTFKGNAALSAEYTKDYKSVIHYEYSNKSSNHMPNRFTIIQGEDSMGAEFEGDASLSYGLSYSFGVAPIVKELVSIETTMKLGTTFYLPEPIKLPISTNKNVIDTLLYDKLNRDDFLCGNLDIVGEIKVSLFDAPNLPTIKWSGELDLDDKVINNPVWKWGLVPKFSDLHLSLRDYEANVKVSRPLIKDVKVGFAIYDKNNKLITTYWQDKPYINQLDTVYKMEKRLVFPGNRNSEFKAYPVVEAFGLKMRAKPFTTSYYPVPFTNEAEITDSYVKFSGYVEGTEIDYPFTAGITVYPFKELEAAPNTDKFEFIVDRKELNHNELYSYCTEYKEGKQTISGNVMRFRTPKSGYEPETESAIYDPESGNLYFYPYGKRIHFDVYENGGFANDRLNYGTDGQGYRIKVKPGAVYTYRAVEVYQSDDWYCGDYKRTFIPNELGLSCKLSSQNGNDMITINGVLSGPSNVNDYRVGYFVSIHGVDAVTNSVGDYKVDEGKFQLDIYKKDLPNFENYPNDIIILVIDKNYDVVATFDGGSYSH